MSSKWRRWMLSREILSFMCSGKMPALRELGMAVDYRDWRLPFVPHLRSLYIPFMADHVHGTNVDPRELAMQIIDIVTLRPEVELCYMGIANKCYEILESRRDDGRPESNLGMGGNIIDDTAASDADDDDDDDDIDEDEEDEEAVEANDTESDEEDDADDSDSETDDRHTARLRLREILFYDDKVAIFKARHGRL
ncbi:hypothetical protein LTR53_007666 [Teratosphaeriaceae sp. CCFEE 6253]|nr:hypothetical protein LTR53_013779 [Teratosphaeriaceae sp. CCFEE 6253]KAK3071967.1 hypothetical protein LTR53_007666 [Teratosphaeriaceae sp. CCFEE 6253]